jgi:hypothetical protein
MTVSPLFQTLFASIGLACLCACEDDASDEVAVGVANLSSSECLEAAPASKPTASRCVISQRDGKKLALQVFGLRTLCLGAELLEDVPWRAVAREEGAGRVVVSVDWPSDKTPGCGSCVYNFKVELGPHDWPERTDIKFEVRACPTCSVDDSRSVTLGTGADERATQACGDEQLDAGSL